MKEAAFKTWFTQQVTLGWSLSKEPWFQPLDPFGTIVVSMGLSGALKLPLLTPSVLGHSI